MFLLVQYNQDPGYELLKTMNAFVRLYRFKDNEMLVENIEVVLILFINGLDIVCLSIPFTNVPCTKDCI